MIFSTNCIPVKLLAQLAIISPHRHQKLRSYEKKRERFLKIPNGHRKQSLIITFNVLSMEEPVIKVDCYKM
jgi:hypothetical protein